MIKLNPKIWFLTGVSGVGKTTLVHSLAKECEEEGIGFLHFDALGVPSPSTMVRDYGSSEMWLSRMIDYWIEIIREKYNQCYIVVLEGSMNLTILQEAIQKHQLTNYEIMLLTCNTAIRHQRLIELRKQPELVNPEMDNWEQHLVRQAEELNLSVFNTSGQSLKTLTLLLKQKFGLV